MVFNIPDVLNEFVAAIEIRSAWGPTSRIDDPFKPGAPDKKGVTGPLLKPQILIYPRGGGDPYSVAPYGTPGATKWPLVLGGLAFLLAVNFGLVFKGARK